MAAERTNKKVSRACNTCRLKRKKCNGQDPCIFCIETKVECSYSREPRRRGPPSGYLRYTETRVNLLETLLGLFIVNSTTARSNVSDTLLESVQTLRAESKTCTQDVWDAYKINWTASDAAKVLEYLAMSFAPFVHRTDQEAVSKPLLPPINFNANSTHSPSVKPASPLSSTSLTLEQPKWINQPQQSSTPASSLIMPQSSYGSVRESFERTQGSSVPGSMKNTVSKTFDLPQGMPPNNRTSERHWNRTPFGEQALDASFSNGDYTDPARDIYAVPSLISRSDRIGFDHDMPMIGVETHSTGLMLPQDLFPSNGYTGSYWRTAELECAEAFPSSPGVIPDFTPAHDVDLPPPHVISHLLDIYFQHVHPSFPFLPPRSYIDDLLSSSESYPPSEGTSALLLAVCAYSGRLSPSMDANNNRGFGIGGAGDAGKVAADLWYEQARTVVTSSLRKESTLETVQTLLLLGLRDHGKGCEGQAWLLVGLAVRMGQDLGLHDPGCSPIGKAKHTPEERYIRRNVWGVTLILDLLLSLQLGRPPATADCLRGSASSSEGNGDFDTFRIPTEPQPLFIYTASLCQIISRINFHLHLGFGRPGCQTQSDKFAALQGELDQWQHALPMQFRISIGHQPEREVLEVHMLYHVAIILLYRPFSKGNIIYRAPEIFLESASTFNVLLEKYRKPGQAQSSHPIQYSLAHSNPNMIYLIFTVAITHLSGFRLRQRESQHEVMNRVSTMTLQTQLHLLNCLEALTTIGETWELAKRCCKMLDKLMEMEGMKPRNMSGVPAGGVPRPDMGAGELGKRKREREEAGTMPIRDDAGRENGVRRHREPESMITVDASPMPQYTHSSLAVSAITPQFVSGGLPSEGSAAFSSQRTLNSTPLGWNSNTNSSPSTLNLTPSPLVPSAAADNFDPALFSFTKWLPGAPGGGDSTGSGAVWESGWDDGSWGRNMGVNYGGYAGDGNG